MKEIFYGFTQQGHSELPLPIEETGISLSLENNPKIMVGRIKVTVQTKTKEGKTLYHRSTTKVEGEQKEI
jgi:hypothetical protein